MSAASFSPRAAAAAAPRPGQNRLFLFSFAAFALVLARNAIFPRFSVPLHLLNHPVEYHADLLSREQHEKLLSMAIRLGSEGKDGNEGGTGTGKGGYPTNNADLNFYNVTHEHVGEAEPADADGTCSDPFLLPSRDKRSCILPGRIDIARHFMMTGGVHGLRENLNTMTARLLSFGRYFFAPEKYPAVSALFAGDEFQSLAKRVCPRDKQYLDPFQFNIIIQTPGQSVATHVDGVYFWGATRFQFPQWLLAVMQFSGLFKDRFVPQVQVVAYLHEWAPAEKETHGGGAGKFVYWQREGNAEPLSVEPQPRAGSAVDGSSVIHAAAPYQVHTSPPLIDKNLDNRLVHVGGRSWRLLSNGTEVRSYTTNDLRISLVYRARCFESAAKANLFKQDGGMTTGGPKEDMLSLEDILNTLADDLVRRGKVRSRRAAIEDMKRLDLAMLLLDTYVAYPRPRTALPVNHCALAKLAPWTTPLLALTGC